MPSVMIFGTFDGLHPGHRFLITKAMERGRITIVVGTDEHVEFIKGRCPRESLRKRMEVLAQEFPAARVMPGSATDFLAPVRSEKPDLILLGYDQTLPPGVSLTDLPCPWERAEAFRPEIFKSSLLQNQGTSVLEQKAEK